MIWADHNPTTKTVAYVDYSSTADEPDNIWKSCPKSQNENIILLEVAHVADDTDPNKHGAGAQEDAAHIIACKDLCLDLYLENGTYDGQCVTNDNQDIPAAHKLQLV